MTSDAKPKRAPLSEAPARDVPVRFGLRWQLVVLFTIAFTIVFAAVFTLVYRFTTTSATSGLRADLDSTLSGAANLIDGDELHDLYLHAERNPAGFSSDRRFAHVLSILEEVHTLEPRAWPYTFVRGDQPDTRRVGARAAAPEFVYLVDVNAIHDTDKAAHFLESDSGSRYALAAWNEGKLVDRPELYTDRFGSWMTSYAPIRDHAGNVVALMGVDFESSYVEQVQSQIRVRVGIVFLVSYALILLLIYFAAGIFAGPVVQLTKATEALREGTLGASLDVGKRSDEVGALARSFNRMSRRLARAFGEIEEANAVLEDRVAERTKDLAAEQEKSEGLLRNVLPQEIILRLKENPQAIAEGYDAVTVLFADIVGFTELSARVSPIELVELLNQIFSTFDKMAEKYGLEKIKTIGDCYMVVGGLPKPRSDHATAIADMALEMQRVMRELREKHPGLAIRIGVHTGPVVAGVLGTKKFSYDLWGDTVNIASRLESHGERDRVQISGAVAKEIEALFDVEERGIIKLKGRGDMTTFWLLARKS